MESPLCRLDADVWIASRPLHLWVGDVGSRMTVLRLPSGDLILHSPIAIDDPIREAVDALGPVRWIVGPSLVHHFYLMEWAAAYPEARLCAAPGLAEKRKDLPFSVQLPDEAPGAWHPSVKTLLFEGAKLMNEVVFLHEPSGTLVLTDLAFNRPPGTPDRAKLFHRLVGATDCFGPHRIIRLAIRDRVTAARSLERIFEWDFDRIVVSHGTVLETGGRARMEAAFAFLRNREISP